MGRGFRQVRRPPSRPAHQPNGRNVSMQIPLLDGNAARTRSRVSRRPRRPTFKNGAKGCERRPEADRSGRLHRRHHGISEQVPGWDLMLFGLFCRFGWHWWVTRMDNWWACPCKTGWERPRFFCKYCHEAMHTGVSCRRGHCVDLRAAHLMTRYANRPPLSIGMTCPCTFSR